TMTIDTPRSKAAIGFVEGRSFRLGAVLISPGSSVQHWAAITLTVIEGESFSSAVRILITASGYTENTNMGWKDVRRSTVGRDWGQAPSLVEGVAVAVTLPIS